ncbi:MAG: hypothetical protein EXS08_03170 [Planctomycetes bacterium]|nr:hypothetical protein [Planctomycetota bacterium]
MQNQNGPLPSRVPALLVGTLLALATAGCGSGGGSDSGFALETTTRAASPSAALVVVGDWIVYLASEAFSGPAGTDLNGDADTTDEVAVVVNTRSRLESSTGVAAQGAVILGSQIYLKVDEGDGIVDWNIDADTNDIVLVHWSELAAVATFVDTLDLASSSELPIALDGRLYYTTATAPVAGDDTSLRYLAEAAPITPVTIQNVIGGGTARVHLLGEDAGLLFCYFDEVEEGVDRNLDLDTTDEVVLALLNGTDAAARVKSTELALASDSEPFDAELQATNDWTAVFLVDEAEQGGTNLNDQTLFSQPLLPENCPVSDADASDRVLFYVKFATFVAGTSLPVNTGLAGTDRVLAGDDFVATISPEADASCNLNADTSDTDTSDEVARWVKTVAPTAPARDAEDLHALATATAGGSKGLSVLDDRLIAVIDEADDDSNLDGKAADHELVAWLDPSASNPTWFVSHQSSASNSFGTGIFDSDGDSEPFAGTSWMAPEAVGGRLALVFLEEVPGTNPNVGSLNTNLDCNLVAKDADKTDGLPVWADFESGPTLDFDGMGYAVDQGNAGIVLAQGFAFFRVSEADDNRDYNADGVKNDVVLFRNPLTTCGPVPMATSSLTPGQVITTDDLSAAAFLSSETQAGIDFNGDGDTGDLVTRWFRF